MREKEVAVARRTHLVSAGDRAYCIDFMRRHGVASEDAQQVVGGVLQSNMACAVPARVEPLEAGQTLHIGGHAFDVLVLGGHSIAQICMYEPRLKLLLTGDQLFERITPNIGVWPYGENDPLPRTWIACAPLPGWKSNTCYRPTTASATPGSSARMDWRRTTSGRCASSWRVWARGA
jgi:hypothetical protein